MSAKAVGVLAHNQPISTRARAHITRTFACYLVQMMAAERISARLIRMFPPGSVFRRPLENQPYIPETLPPAEFGTKFQLPQSISWREEHLQATMSLRQRAWLTMRSFRENSERSA